MGILKKKPRALKRVARSLKLGGVLRALLPNKEPPKYKKPPKSRKPPVQLPERLRSSPTRYLSIAAIFKDEAPYLAEWIEFHRLVGVEHIYLYDNGSTDNPAAVLAPFVRQGFVTIVPWAAFDVVSSPQLLQWAHAIANFGPDFRWMATIDIDEFLFPVEGDTLRKTLAAYEDLPAVAVPWIMFGFSGHETKPDGLVIANYTMRAPFPPPPERDNIFKWKAILQPSEVVTVCALQALEFRGGLIGGGFDENRIILDEQTRYTTARTANVLRINHYVTRSREEFAAKMAKSSAMLQAGLAAQRRRQKFAEMSNADNVYDDTILRFVPALKERLCPRILQIE
jgi:hypothetical protein